MHWLTFTANNDAIIGAITRAINGAAIGGVVGGGGGVVLIIVVIVVVVVVICKTKGGKGMFLHVYMHATILMETTTIMYTAVWWLSSSSVHSQARSTYQE